MSLRGIQNSMEWALMVALVFGAGAIAQAQNQEETKPEGRIVQISPNGDASTTTPQEGAIDVAPAPEAPEHWIGLLGGPVTPELRAHLDVPEDQGLLVRQVVPDSPAAKAGLKDFDILLRANDTDLKDMRDLVELVKMSGDQSAQITLEVLRHGKGETVTITPEARPEKITGMQMPSMPEGMASGQVGPGQGVPEDVLKFFEQRGGREGGPFAFRMFGPGTELHHHNGLGTLPNGISVSIQKPADGPAQITVQRGEESWDVVGDDPGSLEQLPEDVRPFVENLLHGGAGVQMPIPDVQQFQMQGPGGAGIFHDNELQQRLEAMEKQLQQLEERLEGGSNQAPAENE